MKKNHIENTVIINYMTIILNFVNFENNDFINKKSKSKMKDFIKKDLKNFRNYKNDLIKKYLKLDKNLNFDLKLKKNNNEYYLSLIKETNEEKYKKELKDKLKNKINMCRNNNHRMVIESNNFSSEINNLYNKLIKSSGNYIPTPKEILSEKDKYIDLMFQNIVSICEKIKTDNKNVLYSIIDSNDYLNYIQKVCNVNYKDYISDLFKKINELSDEQSNVPKIISSESDNKVNINELTDDIQNMLIDDDNIDDISIKSDDNNLDIVDDMSFISDEGLN